MTLSIRARLTLWYSILVGVALVASGSALLLTQQRLSLRHLDAELARISRAVGSVMDSELDERHDPAAAAVDTHDGITVPGWTVLIASDTGEVLAGNWDVLQRGELHAADIGVWRPDEGDGRTITAAVGEVRVWRESMQHHGYRFTVVVAAPLAPLARERGALQEAIAILLPIALIVAALGGWWIGRQAVEPLASMAAQRALQMQRQFMADASHQLRTPVSVIRTAAQVTLGRTGRAEADYRESLGIVAEQAARLTRMVDDMFLLARVDANGRPLEPVDFYLDDLIADCLRSVRVVAEQRQVRVESILPAGIADANGNANADVPFRGDETLLRQMLTNLLDNAVAYTPPGGRVTVTLRVRPTEAQLEVADTGCGIPIDESERIFERFVRLDSATRTGSGGAGLGLPIARWIAEAHGGSLKLDTTSAMGSRFLVCLPQIFSPARDMVEPRGTIE